MLKVSYDPSTFEVFEVAKEDLLGTGTTGSNLNVIVVNNTTELNNVETIIGTDPITNENIAIDQTFVPHDDLVKWIVIGAATVNAWKTIKQESGVTYNIGGTDYIFDSDPRSRQLVTGAVLDMKIDYDNGNTGVTIDWLDKANVLHTMDFATFSALGTAFKDHYNSIFTQALTYKSTIASAQSAQDVDNVIIPLMADLR